MLTVYHREGNPAAGGAPFAYPITDGPGWVGGFRTISTVIGGEPQPTPAPEASPEVTLCSVPALRGLSLRLAKTHLRAVGRVRLARGATAGKGKVVMQSAPTGTQLAAGAPVAVKLVGH